MTVTWTKATVLVVAATMIVAAVVVASVCVGDGEDARTGPPRATCPNTSERAWLADVHDGTAPLEAALGNLAGLAGEASDNPGVIRNESWREDLIGELVALRLVIDQIRGLDAPPSLRTGDLDHTLDQLAWELEYLIENMIDVGDRLDLRKLDAATSNVITLDGLLQLATIQIESLCD